MSVKERRNYGIDLLRLVAMLYIVILHLIGWGGMLNAAQTAAQAQFMWLMDMWCFPAVNIFGMISGYVAYSDQERKFRLSSYVMIWLQVVFYGVAVTLICQVLRPEWVDLQDLIRVVFPVSNDLYWYFTAYTGLFVLMPILNAGLRGITEKQAKNLMLGILLVFSVFDSVVNRFGLDTGCSVGWLVVLYILGAVMKKCGLGKEIPSWAAVAGIILCMVLPWIWIVGGNSLSIGSIVIQGSISENYTLPMHVVAAMLYLVLFSRMQISTLGKKFIGFAAPGAFAVYLLNCQETIWWCLIMEGFTELGQQTLPMIFVMSVGFALLFVMISVSIDCLRQKLFQLLCIRKMVDAVTCAGEKLIVK